MKAIHFGGGNIGMLQGSHLMDSLPASSNYSQAC